MRAFNHGLVAMQTTYYRAVPPLRSPKIKGIGIWVATTTVVTMMV